MKRMVGVALAALLAVGVVLAVVLGPRIGRDDPGAGSGNGAGAAGATTSGLRTVRGAVGSEKEAFFRDATVRQAFARHGLVTEQVPGTTFRQRRFADRAEAAAAVHDVRRRGLDPTGKESDGWFHADCFVTRPAAAVARTPLPVLLAETVDGPAGNS